jgi:hypothetical protein
LTHRGSLNIQPTIFGNRRGVYTGQNWSSSKYNEILPTAGSDVFADIPGFRAGDWNSVNYEGSQFYFPTDNTFNTNNFYGGDTTNIGGDTNFQNITVQNITINGGINQPGRDGTDGRDGERGEPGPPGDPGTIEPIDPPGGGGQGKIGYPSETVRFITDADINAVHRTIKLTLTKGSAEVLTGVTFNTETCQLQLATTTINYVSDVKIGIGAKSGTSVGIWETLGLKPTYVTKTFLKPNR